MRESVVGVEVYVSAVNLAKRRRKEKEREREKVWSREQHQLLPPLTF